MKKRNTIAIIACFVVFLFHAYTATAQVTWSRNHLRSDGNSVNNYSTNQRGLVQTLDGNYVHLTDTVDANGSAFLKLIKYDLTGNLLWSKIISQHPLVMCKELLELADGRLVVVGDEGTTNKFYWMVLTATGDFIAEYTHHVGTSWNLCQAATLSPAGNIVITGSHYYPNTSNHELVWLEVTPSGNVNWSHYQTGAGWIGYDVEFLADGTGVIGYDKYATDEIGFIRFDAAGNTLSDQLSTEFFGQLLDMEAAPGGGMFVSWHKSGQTKNLAKLDNNLQTTWSILVQPTLNLYKIENLAAFPDGSCAGLVDRVGARLLRVDADGNILWEKPADGSPIYGLYGEDLIVTNDNGLLYTAVNVFNTGTGDLSFRYVTKTDQNGDIIKNRVIGHAWLDTNGNCAADTSAGEGPWRSGTMKLQAATGEKMNFIPDSTGRFSLEIYPNAYQMDLELSSQGYYTPCPAFPSVQTNPYPDTIILDTIFLKPNLPNGLLQGTAFLDINQNGVQDTGDSALACVTLKITTSYPWLITTVVTDEQGMYSLPVYQGSTYNVRLNGSLGNCVASPSYFIVPINGPTATQDVPIRCNTMNGTASMVRGNVLLDANSDCLPDNYSNLIGTWTVKLEDVAGNIFETTTNDQGSYAMAVPPGTYSIAVIVAGNTLNICNIPTTQDVVLGQCLTADIIGQLPNCPSPSVEVSVDRFRPCVTSNIRVNYCNYGADPAYDATLQLLLDPALNFNAASLPIIGQSGDTLSLSLGNLAPLECGTTLVTATLDCNNSIVGQTHCVEATVLPAAPCASGNASWDGSNIELSSRCEQGQVIFTLRNTGTGSMSTPRSYIIIEDNVLLRPDEILTYQLAANGDTSIVLPADGSTFRLETYQAMGHPSGTLTAAWEEGCGANPPGNFSRGFVTQRPYGDEEPFIAIFCDESVGSYDPNLKKAFPKGVGDRHFILGSTELNYQILFQNTGTDTAYLVVLRDTLSPTLDPTTLRPGASSHPFTYSLENGNIAVFRFENINLVDSTTNAPMSNGFVQFSIQQADGNQPGTRIENSVAIYFDFNEPVITPTVFHEIPAPVYYQNNSLTLCAGTQWNGTVYYEDTVVMDTIDFGIYDSVYITTIDVLPTIATSLSAAICEGESYAFGNASYSQSGSYTQVFAAQNGCDSTVTLNLSVLPSLQSSLSATICNGESIAFGNTSYSQSGSYTQIFAAQNGCDSTVTLNLSVMPSLQSSFSATICSGESFAFGNASYSQSGSYTQVFAAQNGCDSTVTLNLYVLPSLQSGFSATICSGESFAFGNASYSQSGSYTQAFAAQNGCDSTVTLNLAVLPTASHSINETLCFGGSLLVNGNIYDESNPTGTEVIENGSHLGCDSIIQINLSFNSAVSSSVSLYLCPDEGLVVNGTLYNMANPTGTEVFPNGSFLGCDSIVYVSLSFYPEAIGLFQAEICPWETIEILGTTFSADNPSGTIVLPQASINGCDSTISLSLTVLPLVQLQVDTAVLAGTEVFGILVTTDTSFVQQIMDENVCAERAVNVQIISSTTTQIANLSNFAISPNPASGQLTLNGRMASGAFCEAKLMDAYGRTVLQLFENEWIAGDFTRRVDLKGIPAGMYFVSFATDGERRVLKLVVE